VVTKIDELTRPGDAERVLDFIRKRIASYLVERASEQFGRDSDEYHAYLRRVGQPKVFGVAAKRALASKQTGDAAGLEGTGMPEVERALEEFLVDERAATVLGEPLLRLRLGSADALEVIRLRERAVPFCLSSSEVEIVFISVATGPSTSRFSTFTTRLPSRCFTTCP